MTTCDYCQHVEMCGWRKELNEQGCEFYDDGNKWIPVEKKLPEPWESVLITFSGKHVGLTADHAVGIGSWDGVNGWYFEEIEGYTDRLTVEAWQPLPEAFKAEDVEEGKG